MMNIGGIKPQLDADQKIVPVRNHGIHCMSLGLVTDGGAVVWRGPMVISCVQRLLFTTAWPRLHTLVVDMPPGTGDVALSIAQLLDTTGAVLVSTPQTVALEDVSKAA